MDILSTDGRPKVVVGLKETKDAIISLLENKRARRYNLQVALMLFIILYSGVRLSSLIPSYKFMEDEWKYLTHAEPNQMLLNICYT
jgi:hypothetical protein